jgi:apolipoprotein N-acyltransferase
MRVDVDAVLPLLLAAAAGVALSAPHQASLTNALGDRGAAWLAFGGLVLLMHLRKPPQQGLVDPRLGLGLAVWQVQSLQWMLQALEPRDPASLWPGLVLAGLLLALNLVPLWLCHALLVASARRCGVRALGLALPLAWWIWAECRDGLWWGGHYGGLALGALDLPWMPWSLQLLGVHGSEAVLLGAAAALAAWASSVVYRQARWRQAWPLPVLGTFSLLPVPSWTQPFGPPLAIAVVQAPAEPADWTLARRDRALNLLHEALQVAPAEALVIGPETLLGEPPPATPHGLWAELLTAMGSRPLIVGMPLRADEPETDWINGALLLQPGPDGAPQARRDGKQRLVPAGEHWPGPVLLQALLAPVFVTTHRPAFVPAPADFGEAWWVKGTRVAPSLCHELAFADALRGQASGAHWLLNLADDSWIPHADYRHQVLRLARLRVMEAARPLLRVSQGQPSVAVDAKGRLRAPDHVEGPWLLTLQPYQGRPPALRVSRWWPALLGALTLLYLFSPRLARRNEAK